ncbi:hypothetical protein B0H13DRAFT_1858734 [Mycena leptocephala]|nr:hypothetical protein B0H13DRAFT_1858734 [Mycena leptocephala]
MAHWMRLASLFFFEFYFKGLGDQKRRCFSKFCRTESHFPYISHSIIALLKLKILKELLYFKSRTVAEALSGLNHYIFPTETAIPIPSEFQVNGIMLETEGTWYEWTFYDLQRQRISEASFDIVAKYLEHCTTDILPYNAVKTLDRTTYYLPPETAIHPTHQIRLASSVQSRAGHSMQRGIKLKSRQPGRSAEGQDAFTDYEKKLMLATDSDLPNTRLQTILQGINSWHPESDSMCPNRDEEGEHPVSYIADPHNEAAFSSTEAVT